MVNNKINIKKKKKKKKKKKNVEQKLCGENKSEKMPERE
jgi:hypothetical protein